MHNIFCYTNDVNNINERNTMTHGTTDPEALNDGTLTPYGREAP